MKKLFFPLVLSLLFAACSQTNQLQTVGPLTLPAAPQAGDEINIQYNMDSSVQAGGTVQHVTLYYTVKDKIYARDVAFSDSGKTLAASFSLPDSAQAFALKFTGETTNPAKEKGYIFPVFDQSGNPVAGAWAGESRFYNGQGSGLLGLQANPDTALVLMKKDIVAHPSIKKQWRDLYLNTLLRVKKDSAYPAIQKELHQMLSGDSVQKGNYQTAYTLYSRMKMEARADSVKAVGIKKFPHGVLAQLDAIQTFNRQKNVDSMVLLYERFKQEFTPSGSHSISSRLRTFMASRIAGRYGSQGDDEQFFKYASQINNPVQRAGLYNNLAWPLAESGKKPAFADSVSKMSIDLIQQSMNHPGEEKPDYMTAADWKRRMRQSYAMYADTYALILFKEGKTDDALAYQKKAVAYSKSKNPDMNERYVQYLIAAKDYTTAQQQLEQFYTDGHTTSKMQEYLKTAYVKVHQSEDGYDNYLAKLEAKAKAKKKAELAKKMINKPAGSFTLQDLKGNSVSLSMLKGKVVVVDFWATWCGPCKASFPGMQKALNKYKGDSNVVFLFVNTWERTKPAVRQKQVTDFIDNHDYTFHVLLDRKDKNASTSYKVVSEYGVKGIPTKFIIGPDGNIKFKKVGFSGNTAAEVKEISMMIEMAGA